MSRSRVVSTLAIIGLSMAVLAGCSSDKKDSGTTTTAGGGITVTTATGGTTVKVVLADTKGTDGPMTMVLDASTAKAGKVTFEVSNEGTIKHEAVLLQEDTAFDKLPVTNHEVSEANNVGEVEVEKGQTKSFTVDLKAAKYVMVCNISKHYEMGMRAPFTVQ